MKTHSLVGKKVRVRTNGVVGVVARVVTSRFGRLAVLRSNPKVAYAVGYCDVVT